MVVDDYAFLTFTFSFAMSLSLRDQLFAAGLINEKQAKQAGKHQGQQRREQAKNPAAAAAEKQRIAAHQAAKAARDAELNRIAQDKLKQKEMRAQIKQLVEQNRLPMPEGEDYYNFIDGKKIRRIPVNPALRARFGKGEIAIVRSDGRYHIVPAAIAERVRERDPHSVVARPDAGEAKPVDENDPYKDFVVPDDLMW